MDSEDARRVAAAWVDAWASGDADRVIELLHDTAVIVDATAAEHVGKVRAAAVAEHVRASIGAPDVPVHRWASLAGVDSVAVLCTMADGTRRCDTLVLADDGRIARAMRHR